MKKSRFLCMYGLAMAFTCLATLNSLGQKMLDSLSVQPKAAYSTRLLSSTYTGPAMQVRRCSDDNLTDVYFDTNGIISLTSPVSLDGGGPPTATTLGTWVGGSSAFVMIWYDQTASGNNATQTVKKFQPRIVDSGTVEQVATSKPSLRMLRGATGGNGFNLPFNLLGVNDLNLFVAIKQNGNTTIGNHIFGSSGPTGATPGKLQVYYHNTTQVAMQSSVSASTGRLAITAGAMLNVRFKLSPDASGTGQITSPSKTAPNLSGLLGTAFTDANLSLFRIGDASYTRNFEGFCPEVIYFSSAICATDANTILSNQASFCVFEPPISTAATNITASGYRGNWTPPASGAPSTSYTYTFQHSTTPDFSSGVVTTNNISSSILNGTVSGLLSNTDYWFRVLLITGGAESGWSAVRNLKTSASLMKTMDFDASTINSGSLLRWKAQERLSYFELERSADGKTFDVIAEVKAADPNSEYTYIDHNPVDGMNYYRLKQVSQHGIVSNSDLKEIEHKPKTLIRIFPNPAQRELNVQIHNTSLSNIKIISSGGRVVKEFKYKNGPIDVSALTPGIYIISGKDETGKFSFHEKFIKQ